MIDLSDIAASRLLASQPDTVSDVLGQLAQSSDRETRRNVAANPNTPVPILLQLGHEFPRELLNNPVFSLLLLEGPDLLEKIPLRTLQSLLRQPDVPQYFLEQTAERAEVEIQTGLVLNPETPKPVLERLVQSRDRLVQDAAKLHVNWAGELEAMDWQKVSQSQQTLQTSPRRTSSGRDGADVVTALCILAQFGLIPEPFLEEWLETFHRNEFSKVCIAAAASSATSEAMLIRLAKNSELDIYKVAIHNQNLSSEALGAIAAQARNGYCEIWQADEAVKILEARKQPQSEQIRPKRCHSKIKQKSQQVPPIFISWGREPKQKKPETDLVAAKDTETSAAQLEQLAQHPDRKVRAAVVENPNTPLSVLLEYAAREPSLYEEFRQLIKKHRSRSFKRLHPDEIKDVLDIFSDISTEPLEQKIQSIIEQGLPEHRRFLASCSDLSAEVLEQLANIDDTWLQEQVADHPNTSAETLELLSLCEDYTVREAVAYNERTPNHCLMQLVQDNAERVRQNAMQNPRLSEQEVTELLCSQRASGMLKWRPQIDQEYPGCASQVIEYYTSLLEQYTTSKDWFIRSLACKHYGISVDALDRLSQAKNWLERLAVAQNPRTPQQLLEGLAQDSNQVVRFVAQARLHKPCG